MENPNKIRGTAIGVIVGTAVATAAFWFINKDREPTFDEVLGQMASELNKTCPSMVDQDTQLDNAVALPGKVFRYNYTLIHHEAAEIDTAQVKSIIEPTIAEGVKTEPGLQLLREKEATVSYHYRDKNGKYLMEIRVEPEDYR